MEQHEEAMIEFDSTDTSLPQLLTIEEAARVLRIGRSLAYQLARAYESSDGDDGLPVIRVGTCLRVPRWALIELVRTGRVVSLRPGRPNIASIRR